MHNIIIQNNKASVVSFLGLWKGTQILQSDVCTMNKLFHTINIFAQRCHIDKKSSIENHFQKICIFQKTILTHSGTTKTCFTLCSTSHCHCHCHCHCITWNNFGKSGLIWPTIRILKWNQVKNLFYASEWSLSRLRHDNVRMSFGRNVSIKFFCGHICPFFKCSLKNIDKNN